MASAHMVPNTATMVTASQYTAGMYRCTRSWSTMTATNTTKPPATTR